MLSAVKWIGITLVGFVIVLMLIIVAAGQETRWLLVPTLLGLLVPFAFWIALYTLIASRSRKIGHADYNAPRPELPTEDDTKRRQMPNS